jgi:hypothetical protein
MACRTFSNHFHVHSGLHLYWAWSSANASLPPLVLSVFSVEHRRLFITKMCDGQLASRDVFVRLETTVLQFAESMGARGRYAPSPSMATILGSAVCLQMSSAHGWQRSRVDIVDDSGGSSRVHPKVFLRSLYGSPVAPAGARHIACRGPRIAIRLSL